ncbi:MAG TPA: NAD(P)-dependent oxidoreductase [Fibrobacteria bacterium]|nr:NAD(P)-dependent oxidoreductase [Fibrobacteria bacterium]HOX49932.1 NAD(P)-dependent oxidoreductase [Fibrobacteria bacterium]
MDLFFTGGTGFVGSWMNAVLLHAVDLGSLEVRLRLLTRDPDRIRKDQPQIAAHRCVKLVRGDVLGDGWDCEGASHLVAGATEASAALIKERPRLMLESIVDGTRRTLDQVEKAGTARVLFLSSGAAAGPQPPGLERVREEQYFGLDPFSPRIVYAEGKRLAELLLTLHRQASFSFTSSRMWAFVGPLLPMDTHFAVGNFLLDALSGRKIRILGDGTTIRSYQYAAEMAAWNWVLLASGRNATAYNVGSDRAVTTRELASLCSGLAGGAGFEVLGTPDASRRTDVYVPEVSRMKDEFDLVNQVDLEASISRTLEWCKERQD